jgi:hypothetical protein
LAGKGEGCLEGRLDVDTEEEGLVRGCGERPGGSFRAGGISDRSLGRVTFVMLNPSLADALVDDRTIGRCISFAANWGFGALDVANLFAYRTSKPEEMKRATDPVGPENNRYLSEVISEASLIVCAWGNHASAARVREFKNLATGRELVCLARTLSGAPRHPVYVPGDAQVAPWVIEPYPPPREPGVTVMASAADTDSPASRPGAWQVLRPRRTGGMPKRRRSP